GRARDDARVTNMTVTHRDVAGRAVHGDNVAATDHEFATARCGGSLRGCASERGEDGASPCRSERGRAREEAAACCPRRDRAAWMPAGVCLHRNSPREP